MSLNTLSQSASAHFRLDFLAVLNQFYGRYGMRSRGRNHDRHHKIYAYKSITFTLQDFCAVVGPNKPRRCILSRVSSPRIMWFVTACLRFSWHLDSSSVHPLALVCQSIFPQAHNHYSYSSEAKR